MSCEYDTKLEELFTKVRSKCNFGKKKFRLSYSGGHNYYRNIVLSSSDESMTYIIELEEQRAYNLDEDIVIKATIESNSMKWFKF